MGNVWQLIGVGSRGRGNFLSIWVLAWPFSLQKAINRILGRIFDRDRHRRAGLSLFDLMHEAVEQTGATDPLSWVAFLGKLAHRVCRVGPD